MLTLDNCHALDSDNMLDKLIRFPDFLEEAHKLASQISLPALKSTPRTLIICGMGGSAIGAELLRGFLSKDLPCPIVVIREPRIPGFASPQDLCIVCSYSGNTEETCHAMLEAAGKNIPVIAMSTGGKMQKLAEREQLSFVQMPGTLKPRVALPTMFMYFWHVLDRCGLCTFSDDTLHSLLSHLHDIIPAYGAVNGMNPALELAERLQGTLPIIYSTASHLHPVAVRWKNQFCENAKQFSYVQAFPELMHNEVMGWELENPLHKHCRIVLLRDSALEPVSLSSIISVTRRQLNAKSSGIEEYSTSGESLLSRIFSLVIFGDFVSYYLAILNGIDPTPIGLIDSIKASRQ